MSRKVEVMVHVLLLVAALAMQVLGVTMLATSYAGSHPMVAFGTWFVLTMIEPPIVLVLASEAPDAGDGGTGEARQ